MEDNKKYGTCVKCKCNAPKDELEENAEIFSYGFKNICNTCAERIDDEIESIRQDI